MTEQVTGDKLQPGDVVYDAGYEWVIDSIHGPAEGNHPPVMRYVLKCHWSGMGPNPRFFNDDMTLGKRVDLPWTRKI